MSTHIAFSLLARREICFDATIPTAYEAHFAKLFDIHMMCWGTGRERTAHEYSELLERAGWMPITVRPSPGLMSAIEARKPG